MQVRESIRRRQRGFIVNPYVFVSGSGGATHTAALLHLDGANGSTSFPDEVGGSWASVGSPTISTAQSQFGGASLLLNGTTQALWRAHNAKYDIGTGDFTIEAWVRRTAGGAFRVIFGKQSNTTSGMALQLRASDTNKLQVVLRNSDGTNTQTVTSSADIPLNTWAHVAVTRASGTVRLFLNGTQDGSLAGSTQSLSGNWQLTLGALVGPSFFWAGYIDEFRFTVGLARYTASFTPSGPFVVD